MDRQRLRCAADAAMRGWAALILLLSCASLLIVRTYPFTDLPNHIAEAVILKQSGNPASPLPAYFTVRIGPTQPTIAHMVIASWFPSPEVGMRLLYLAYVLAVPLLSMLLARRCGGDPFVALLSVLVLWNYNCLWGFTGFTLAIPVLLVVLLAHIRFAARRSWPNGMLLAVALCAVYWFHVLALAAAALSWALFEAWMWVSSRPRRLPWAALLPPLPGLLLLAGWRLTGKEFEGEGMVPFLGRYYATEFLHGFGSRWPRLLVNDGRALAPGALGLAAAVCGSVCLGGFLAVGLWRARRRGRVALTPPRAATVAFTAAALACYLFLPGYLPGENYIYQRYSAIVLLGVASIAAWTVPPVAGRLPRVVALLAASAYAVAWFHFFWGFRGEDREFRGFFPRTPEMARATVGAVIDAADYRGWPALIHYNSYHIAWNGAPTPTRLLGYRYGVVRAGAAALPKYLEWVERAPPGRLRKVVRRFAGLDYIVVRGGRPRELLEADAAYVLVRESPHWALFRRTAPASVPPP